MEMDDGGGGSRPPPLIPPRGAPVARKRSREEIEGDALLQAASQNNAFLLRELIKKREVPVDWCNRDAGGGGQTALHIAAFNANVEALRALVEMGASINLPNDISGATPLHLAAMGKGTRPRKMEAIALLVAAGADCFLPDRYGSQPWHYAQDEEARLLMKGPEFRLHDAVLNKDLGALSGLLQGAEAAQVDSLGRDGNTPLHIAACVRCAEAARMLLRAGANPNEINEHGATPLHTAVSVLAEDVMEVLIAAGATVDRRSILVYEFNSRGINWVEPGEGTPQSSPKSIGGGGPGSGGGGGGFGSGPSPRNRREYRRRESTSSSEGEGGGPGERETFEDKTPLHLAVATKNGLGAARLLLAKGADPNAPDAKGRTCLHLALDRLLEVSPMGILTDTEACFALIKLLLAKGADPLRPHPAGTGGSCAHWCVMSGHVDALEVLLAHTFGVVRARLLNGEEPSEGLTPLMLSARENKVGCLESLLRNGADAGLVSSAGGTARALAERQGHTAAVCILDTFSSFAGVA